LKLTDFPTLLLIIINVFELLLVFNSIRHFINSISDLFFLTNVCQYNFTICRDFNAVLNDMQPIRLPERSGHAVRGARRVASIPGRLQPA